MESVRKREKEEEGPKEKREKKRNVKGRKT